MTNEFDNEENVVPDAGNNEPIAETGAIVEEPVIETGEISSGNYQQKSPKGIVAILAIIVALVGLVYAFTCTNLKYITSPNKMAFMNSLDEDIKAVTDFCEDNELVNFFASQRPKVLDISAKEGSQKVSATAVINKDSIAFKVNDTNDKVYLIDLNNLEKLYENFGIEDQARVDADTFSEKEIEAFKDFYLECYNIFKKSLTNDDFIVTKDNKITINGKEIEADSVELKITEVKIMEIAKLWLEELRDSKVIDILFAKFEEMEEPNELGMTKEEFLESLDEALASYDEEMADLRESITEGYHDESYIIYRMYNKKGVIARELIIGSDEEVDSSMTLITDNDYYEFNTVSESLFSGTTTTTLSDTITQEKDATYHNIKLVSQYNKRQYVPANNDDSENPFASIWGTYEYVPVTEEETCKIKVENDNTKFTLVGVDDVDVVIDIDDKLKVDVSAGGFDVNFEILENKKMTTKKLIKDGAVIVNDMTMEKFEEEMEEISAALMEEDSIGQVQSRSQVNADIRTGEQIGKAIKIWSIDGTSREIPETPVKYSELEQISDYIGADYKPTSLEGGDYYVANDDGKITVAIATNAYDAENLFVSDIYDGSGAGWAYIEGQY